MLSLDFWGVIVFVFNLIALTFWKETVAKSIIGNSLKLLTYVPLEVFSALGFVIAFLWALSIKDNMVEGDK